MKIKELSDLENGDIVTLRNGEKMIYCDEGFTDLSSPHYNSLSDTYDLNDDMTMEDRDEKDSDIMIVERPIKYEKVYDRKETIREMTVEEVSKELGYEVKIVKE